MSWLGRQLCRRSTLPCLCPLAPCPRCPPADEPGSGRHDSRRTVQTHSACCGRQEPVAGRRTAREGLVVANYTPRQKPVGRRDRSGDYPDHVLRIVRYKLHSQAFPRIGIFARPGPGKRLSSRAAPNRMSIPRPSISAWFPLCCARWSAHRASRPTLACGLRAPGAQVRCRQRAACLTSRGSGPCGLVGTTAHYRTVSEILGPRAGA